MRLFVFVFLVCAGAESYASSAKESIKEFGAEKEKINALARCGVAYKMLADVTGSKEDGLSVAEIQALAQETIAGSEYGSLVRDKYQESLQAAQGSLQSQVNIAAAVGGAPNEYAERLVKVAEPYIKECLPYMRMIEVQGGGTVFVRR